MTSVLQLNPQKVLPYWYVDSEVHFPLGKSREIDLDSLSLDQRSQLEVAIKNEILLVISSDTTEKPSIQKEDVIDLDESIPPMALHIGKDIVAGSILSAKRQLSGIDPQQKIPSKLDILRACLLIEKNSKKRKGLTAYLIETIQSIASSKFSKLRDNIDSLVNTMQASITEEEVKTVTLSPVAVQAEDVPDKEDKAVPIVSSLGAHKKETL